MGLLIEARCSCGYASEPIAEGHGFVPGRENRPARCDACREVVQVNILEDPVQCPLCGGTPTEIYDQAGDPDLRVECPRCLDAAMVFRSLGIWD